MTLLQITTVRIIQIFLGLGAIAAFFIYLAYKILKQDRTRLKNLLSAMYITVACGLILNIINVFILISGVAEIINLIVVYVLCFGAAFLAVFSLLFYLKEEKFRKSYQFLYVIIFGILLAVIFIIPEGTTIGIETNWYPKFNIAILIYLILVNTSIVILPTLIYSFKIYAQFEDDILKKKWLFFIVGTIELFSLLLGTFITNTLHIDIMRTVWAPISLFLSVTGAYLMYYGIAKKF
jgi:hypothetical protein